jgi:hypothetical protein
MADGQPHSLDEITAGVSGHIRPETALRSYESQRRRAGVLTARRELDTEQQAHRGRKYIVRSVLVGLGVELLGPSRPERRYRLPSTPPNTGLRDK